MEEKNPVASGKVELGKSTEVPVRVPAEHESEYAIEMLHITKRFPGIIANDDITLQLRKGEIHALLGENGAGKSTRCWEKTVPANPP